MQTEVVQQFKDVSTQLLKAKKKLDKIHASFHARTKADGFARARTTTYNARTANIIEHEVDPLTKELKQLAAQVTH